MFCTSIFTYMLKYVSNFHKNFNFQISRRSYISTLIKLFGNTARLLFPYQHAKVVLENNASSSFPLILSFSNQFVMRRKWPVENRRLPSWAEEDMIQNRSRGFVLGVRINPRNTTAVDPCPESN